MDGESRTSRVTTNTASTSVVGRYHAAFIVLVGFLANFVAFGVAFTFGVFQEYYSSRMGPLSHSSQTTVSMIGSVASASTYSFAIFNNAVTDYLKTPKLVMLMGAIIMAVAMTCASFCQEQMAYQFILSQGLLFGIGSSFAYMPPVVCAPPFFTRNRGLAIGIVFAGTGFGAVTFAPLTRYLLSHVGWRWTLRILGLISFGVLAPISLLVNQHPSVQGHDPKPLRSLFTQFNLRSSNIDGWSLISQLGAGLFQAAGYLISLNFMSTYARSLGFSAQQGANFIALSNGINAIFKVVIGFFADQYLGRLNTIILCNFMSAAAVFSLWLVGLKSTFLAFVVLYGVFSGAIISLLPTCLSEIFGVKNYKSISGMMYFFRGVGNLLGSPIAALLITNASLPKGYQNAIIYNGVMLTVSTLFLGTLKLRADKSAPVRD